MIKSGQATPTVLVVDDFEDSRFVHRQMLAMRDYSVIEAASG